MRSVPRVVVVHGDGMPPQSRCAASEPGRFVFLQPPCERFGTHHSKALFIVRPAKLTVAVLSGNFVFADVWNKTNGIWIDSFPRARAPATAGSVAAPIGAFGEDLDGYYREVRELGMHPPSQWQARGCMHALTTALHPLPTGELRQHKHAINTRLHALQVTADDH